MTALPGPRPCTSARRPSDRGALLAILAAAASFVALPTRATLPTPTLAAPRQSATTAIYLPYVRVAPPQELTPAGSAWGEVAAVTAHGDRALIGEGTQVVALRRSPSESIDAVGRSAPLGGIVRRILWDGGATAYVVTRATQTRLRPDYAPIGPLVVSVLGLDETGSVATIRASAVITGFADIQVHGGHAFVCGGSGFAIYDLSDPGNWREVTRVDLPGGPKADGMVKCRHDGEHTLGILGNRDYHLFRYDVSDPARPSLTAVTEKTAAHRFFLSDFAVAAGEIHALWTMTPIAGVPTFRYVPSDAPGFEEGVPSFDFGSGELPGTPIIRGGLAWFGTHLGVAGAGSLIVVDPGADVGPRQRARLALNLAPADMTIDSGRAWLAGEGLVQAVDIADPDDPRPAGLLGRPGRLRGIAAAGGRVFVASADRREVRVFRGTDPAHAEASLEGTVMKSIGTAAGAPLVVLEELPQPQDGVSLALYDVGAGFDPLGRLRLDAGDIHGLLVVPGHVYLARESTTLVDPRHGLALEVDIIDIADPTRPVLLSRTALDQVNPREFGGMAVQGDRLFVARGRLGTVVELDIRDPAAPVVAATRLLEGAATTGGLAIAGGRLFVAAGATGVRVVDIDGAGRGSDDGDGTDDAGGGVDGGNRTADAGGWRVLGGMGAVGTVLDVAATLVPGTGPRAGMIYAITGEGRLVTAELRPDGALAPAESFDLPAGGYRIALDVDRLGYGRLWVDMGAAGASAFDVRRR